jgi:hypothetical protein
MNKVTKAAALGVVSALVVGGATSPALAHSKGDRYDKKWSAGLSIGDSASDGKKGKGKYRHVDSTPADADLRTAIKAANDAYKLAADAAKTTYVADTADARATRDAALLVATTELEEIVANLEFRAATQVARETRDAANDAAYGVWLAAVEAALATYDAATTTGDVLNARVTYRSSVSAAAATYRAETLTIKTNHIAAVETAQTNLVAALGLATTDADADLAWADYATAIAAANTAEAAAKTAAKDAYKTATTAARSAYTTATGLQITATPKLDKLLKVR